MMRPLVATAGETLRCADRANRRTHAMVAKEVPCRL